MKLIKTYIYFLIISNFCFYINAQETTDTFTTPGSSTFTVPNGVSQITVEAWGAGGGGSSANTAGGGGGGGYARSILTVTPGQQFNYTVGAGGAQGVNGQNTTFGGSITASGGTAGSGSNGGQGGQGSGGNVKNQNGGNGGNGGNGTNGQRGGGGGGGAASNDNGQNGQNNSGNTGGAGGIGGSNQGQASSDGGSGGAGGNGNNGPGVNGSAPGGGGGGAAGPGGGNTSGSGANGQVVITYTISSNNPPNIALNSPASTSITITEGDTVNFDWSGTDSDGTIVSGTWRPTSAIALTNAIGSPGAGPFSANQTYNTAGTFTARVQVEDNDSSTAFVDITITVEEPQPCDGNVFTSVFTPTTDVLASYLDIPEQLNLYTNGTDNYSFGVGVDNNLLLEAFQVSGPLNFAVDRLADRVEIRRAGNSGQGANGEERHILFFENDATYSGSTKNFSGGFFPLMEDALVDVSINRGADNVFNNSGGTNINNIERIDYIFEDGIVVPDPPSEGGFPVFERGGNDSFTLGLIKDLDSNSDPSEYGAIISFDTTDWTPTNYTIDSSVLSGFPLDGGNLVETANLDAQEIDVIFISFANMGLSAGDIVYGYSLAGADVTTDCTEFLDFSNPTFFPQTTDSSIGGLDLLSGGSFSKTAYIHTQTGWYQGEDPNNDITDCDDTLVVSGGTASINSDKIFNKISATQGELNLNSNNITLCGDINTILPFEVIAGSIAMVGPNPQFIRGNDIISVDELIIDNSSGVGVETNLNINGVLDVNNGNFTTNNKVLLPCFFTEPTTGDFQNGDAGQIGPIGTGGSIIGNVSVEQCYPGRRAYRFISSSTTTTTSIHDNWQENATAYNDFPPNAIQDDGIEYGFGTHITGVTHNVSGNAVGQQNLDQVDGLDWQPSGNASMFEFDESTQQFNPVLVTESGGPTETATLQAGKPYLLMIRGSREVDLESNASPTYNTKLRSTGLIEQGDVTYNPSVNAGEFMLIGNPYHAIVDMKNIINKPGNANLNRFMWVFDPTLGGAADSNPTSALQNGRGAYVTIDLNANNPGSGNSSESNQYLQAYKGVFMRSTANNPTITFGQDDKVVNQNQTNVFNTSTDKITIKLYDQISYSSNNTSDDILEIQFGQNENNGVDYDDAPKFINPDENLGRLEGSSLLSIENRSLPQIGEVLELFTDQYLTTDYMFVVNVDGLLANTISLYDNYTGTETVLNNDASTAVSFTVDPTIQESEATDRFELRFDMSTLGADEFALQEISVYPNPASDILNINLGDNTGRFESLGLYDISGRLIATKNLSDEQMDVQLDVNSFSSGIYILKVSSGAEQFSTKVIIE